MVTEHMIIKRDVDGIRDDEKECTHHCILDNSLNTDGADESADNKDGDERT